MQTTAIKRSFIILLAILLFATLTLPNIAYATPTAAEKQAEAQAALSSLNSMQKTLNKASDDYFVALDELDAAHAAVDEAQGRIDEATEKIGSLQDKLGTRAKGMYRGGNTSFLDILFGAHSFEEFATSWDLLNRMNQEDADMVAEVKDLRVEIEAQKVELARQEAIASDKADEAKAIKDQAEETTASMQALYDGLSAEAAELLEQERAAAEAAAAAQAAAVVSQASNFDSGSGSSSGSGSGFSPSYNSVTGNAIVDRAYGCIGAPYVWGAAGPSSFDCSGLVSYAVSGSYSRIGTTYTFMAWSRVSDPQPGDIAVNSGHCGIYIGGGQMIHAPQSGETVKVGPVQAGMIFVRP